MDESIESGIVSAFETLCFSLRLNTS